MLTANKEALAQAPLISESESFHKSFPGRSRCAETGSDPSNRVCTQGKEGWRQGMHGNDSSAWRGQREQASPLGTWLTLGRTIGDKRCSSNSRTNSAGFYE